ncbi:MAG: Rieske (2Fe-2S) protein [Candidatus Nanopelagicales bacterium]|nr:Rieske (2Fe-2S) protein [Candidatus Nanopelagicales bacterium]
MTTTPQEREQAVAAHEQAAPDHAVSSVFSRRNVLAVGALGAAGVALAACSSKSSDSGSAAASESPSGGQSGTGAGSGSGAEITSVSKVPVGGAIITDSADTGFVVSQQKAGEVACYSAVCPHQGCLCSQIQGEVAVCPCHGSRFNVFTGDVVQGPATTGLTKVEVKVAGGKVVQA